MSLSIEASSAAHLPAAYRGALPLVVPPPQDGGRIDLPLQEVSFRPLTTPQQVRQILHLRDDYLLPAAVRSAPAFIQLEKKETRRGWSVRSSAGGAPSARSASCR